MVYPVGFASFVSTSCSSHAFSLCSPLFLGGSFSWQLLLLPPTSYFIATFFLILPPKKANSSLSFLLLRTHLQHCTTSYGLLQHGVPIFVQCDKPVARGLLSAFIKLHDKVSLLVFLPFFGSVFSPAIHFPFFLRPLGVSITVCRSSDAYSLHACRKSQNFPSQGTGSIIIKRTKCFPTANSAR